MTKIKATNITWHEGHVGREEREKLLKQKGALMWMTGLSGSGKSTIAYTLEHALDLCDALGAGMGVAVDCYHVWWDPKLEGQIARAGDRILGFHVCDWLVPTVDLVWDRGMMGDGVIDIPRIRGWVEAAGYRGFNEVEIFSERNWWKRDPVEVVDTCIERYENFV